jgi:hypothetical protein
MKHENNKTTTITTTTTNTSKEGGATPASNGHAHEAMTHNLTHNDLTPPARRNAPPGTSEVAARMARPAALTQAARIIEYITARGPEGATDDEGEATLGIKCQSYTPRRRALVKIGLVADSGRRRHTTSKRPATVWVLAKHARRQEGGAQ